MRFNLVSKANLSRLPKSAGVYVFKKNGRVLYIGKATNLKERVKNHLSQPTFRDNLFIGQTEKIGFIKTDSEIEALILEANLIKKYRPKYNVAWRDDKNYFFVGITKENFPRVFITHQPAKIFAPRKVRRASPKIDYIGPFVEGRALKQTLNTLRRIFPYRACKLRSGSPCLWYQLSRCPGPCLLGSKLAGQMPGLEQKIVKEHSFFSTLRYARVKKESQRNVRNLKKILEGKKKQALKNLKREMKDASKVKDYERAAKVRDRITALEKVLSHDKIFAWPESEVIQLRRSPRLYDWRETEKKLGGIFKTGKKISRIEAYDVSNIQGQSATGSMVAFVNGEPNKNFYRRFRIRTEGKPDDVAMLKEVLTRRFSHREWGLPDLILIDGGKAQMNAAVSSIKYKASGIKIPVTAIAKRENKLFIEEKKQPVLLKDLPRDVFNLILQLRDEAHRFALSYHRKLREKF